MICRGCGAPTYDRHHWCWKCRHYVSSRFAPEPEERGDGRCQCAYPRPTEIGGIWGPAQEQCGRCGRKI